MQSASTARVGILAWSQGQLLRNPSTSGISIIRPGYRLSPRSIRIGGFGKRSSCCKPGINRRNKLCRWVEVSGKIEFADSASPGSRRGSKPWRERKGGGKRCRGLDKSPQFPRDDGFSSHESSCLSPFFLPPSPSHSSRRFLFFVLSLCRKSSRCLLCLSRRQLFDPASGTYPTNPLLAFLVLFLPFTSVPG